jgi:hypothetical protein
MSRITNDCSVAFTRVTNMAEFKKLQLSLPPNKNNLDKVRMQTVDMASTAGILFDLLFEKSLCFLSSP